MTNDVPPRFDYYLTTPSNPSYGYITLGDKKIHHIDNVHEFYTALGYTEEVKNTGELAEEFVWSEYRKDNSKRSEICLQIKILKYLRQYSTVLNEKYDSLQEYWFISCAAKSISNSAMCMDCIERTKK